MVSSPTPTSWTVRSGKDPVTGRVNAEARTEAANGALSVVCEKGGKAAHIVVEPRQFARDRSNVHDLHEVFVRVDSGDGFRTFWTFHDRYAMPTDSSDNVMLADRIAHGSRLQIMFVNAADFNRFNGELDFDITGARDAIRAASAVCGSGRAA